MLIRGALARLFAALFFSQASFNIYWAALPLYFSQLGFDPTLIGLLIGAAGIAELVDTSHQPRQRLAPHASVDRVLALLGVVQRQQSYGLSGSCAHLLLSAVAVARGLRR